MPRAEADIMNDIRRVHNALSPENLHCDGEISRTAARKKGIKLNRDLAALERELGRKPTEQEIWGV